MMSRCSPRASRFLFPAVLLVGAAGVAQAAPPSMYALEPTPELLGPGSVEEYELQLELGDLRDAPEVSLVLPDGLYLAKAERIDERERGVFWQGRIHGAWEVLLTEHEGALSGIIYTPWVVYEITSGPSGRPRLAHVDQSSFPGCADADVPSGGSEKDELDTSGTLPAGSTAPATALAPVVLDVMVMYSPQARSGAGGTSQINSTIQSAVDITNTAYANSGANVVLNLVHTAETNFNESGDAGTDLTNLRTNTQVANLRNTYGADMVGMLVNSFNACGIGYVQRSPGSSFAPFAFQVTARGCAVGNLSFAHEFGHNQGCEHDPANGTSPSNASYPYSFGHFHSGAYRTVMSYSNQCSGGCSRAPYFSNPAVSNQGLPTGIANQRDNHRTINNTSGIVAAFRASATSFAIGRQSWAQSGSGTWYTRSFSGAPSNPVIIMGPPSYNGGHPSTMRVRSAGSSSFQYQLDEWDYLDGGHITEAVDWIAATRGSHFMGSLRAEGGSVNINHNWTTVSLSQSFSGAPVILPQVVTFNGPSAVTVRVRNVTSSSFQVRLQEEEGNDGTHATETVHYFAVEPGSTTVGSRTVRVGRTSNSVTDAFATVGFSSVSSPRFFAAMQTYDGGDAAALRYRNLSTTSVQVKVEEETSRDSETAHTTEVVGYMVVEG